MSLEKESYREEFTAVNVARFPFVAARLIAACEDMEDMLRDNDHPTWVHQMTGSPMEEESKGLEKGIEQVLAALSFIGKASEQKEKETALRRNQEEEDMWSLRRTSYSDPRQGRGDYAGISESAEQIRKRRGIEPKAGESAVSDEVYKAPERYGTVNTPRPSEQSSSSIRKGKYASSEYTFTPRPSEQS